MTIFGGSDDPYSELNLHDDFSFDRHDANKDGVINREEYYGIHQHPQRMVCLMLACEAWRKNAADLSWSR